MVTWRCPNCGGWKSPRARVCRDCYPSTRVAGGAQHPEQVAPIRTIDAHRPPDWRPPHLPPACPTCHGFAYVQGAEGDHGSIEYRRKVTGRASTRHEPGRRSVAGSDRVLRDRCTNAGGWHPCPDCLAHPGSVMSHAAWTEQRR